jgi:broad-specificity NMP kinase
MVWLIGGPPRCGKTTLASRVAEKRRIPYFSIDHVASVITPYIPADQQDMNFPLKAARRQFNDNKISFFLNTPLTRLSISMWHKPRHVGLASKISSNTR